ncbi:hypothetical protein ACFY2Y_15485 [Janibacter hoylei]|uniref:hypothetical protein n=1 Tax=Janibacter hoylei TaxID=364298 RepID=UPI0027B93532|nr:hypothetical protein [Janibacter hoylei]
MRAREAKAKVDARRAERDQRISQVQTDFFIALAEREEAEEAIARAEDNMARAVQALTASDLKVSVDDVADLCELTTSEVRSLKKRDVASGESDGDAEGSAPASEGPLTEVAKAS